MQTNLSLKKGAKIVTDYLLKVTNLTKKIKKDVLLNDVNLQVKKNTIYGLLGPNGAGKSTTLKIISGLMEKTSGQIVFNNHPWQRNDLDNIGSLIESPAIYENLSAYENLEVLTTTLGIDKGQIDTVLEMVGLENVDKKKKTKKYSMGMKQRLGIAMALINRPQLLILDEPTNGLDPIAIQELRGLIKRFSEQNITTLVSSHILSEVEMLVDDIGIIVNGTVHYEDHYDPSQNLEELFMDIVRQYSEEKR